jgi:hypothetical protein
MKNGDGELLAAAEAVRRAKLLRAASQPDEDFVTAG